MKTVPLEPMLALFNLSGIEVLFLLIFSLILPAMALGAFVLWFNRPRDKSPAEKTRRFCPECGRELSPDAPQGLCPTCLMKVGLGSQFEPSGQPVNRPSIPSLEEIAKLFPQFEFIELLGQGGMGMVYKVRQPQLERFVALKVLSPELSRDPAFAERFSREAKALAKLNHPNIVGVYDFGKAGEYYFLTMEYVDGVNLWQMQRTRERLKPEEALAIVPKICDALQYAHDEGIVHRDIKPANILIDKKGRVKIADFGLAKLVGKAPENVPLTQSRMTMGTPHYMAPEQIEKPLDVDHRADIYSLGVVFYEMLTGELPLGRFPLPSERIQVDVRLDEVVLRALAKEPGRRYQQASEIKSAVETVSGATANIPPHLRPMFAGYEYRSKKTLFGLPLLHIAFGSVDPATGKARVAKGIFAIGTVAKGVIAIGGRAWGIVALGGVAGGLLAFGGVAFGLLAIGGICGALLFGFGGIAAAPISIGGTACGYYAMGGSALGSHVFSAKTVDPIAREFFLSWVGEWLNWMMIIPFSLGALLPLLMAFVMWSKKVSASLGIPDQRLRSIRFSLLATGVVSALLWFFLAPMLLKPNAWSRLLNTRNPMLSANYDGSDSQGAKSIEIQNGLTMSRIQNTNDAPLQVMLLQIIKPSLTTTNYAISGRLKYENVQGDGFLEMWSYFPPLQPGQPEGQYFSRTLGENGADPMRKISGSSDWRDFTLPFFSEGASGDPTRLELNLFLPGRGVVYLENLKLTQWGGVRKLPVQTMK